jgi:putative addiction module component (TIGR02574 family)
VDLQSVLTAVEAWPAEDRLRLIEEVWDSLATAPEAAKLTGAQEQDLQRCLDAYRDNPKAGSPWEEVKVSIYRRLPNR